MNEKELRAGGDEAPRAGEEEKLVRKAARGDRKAFSALVEIHKKSVYGFAFRMTGNHADADDIAQLAFLRAFQGIKGFRPGTKFRSWLLAIASHAGTDLYRRKSSRREVALPSDGSPRPSPEKSPAAQAMGNENGILVWKALEFLPADQRAVLVLHAMEDVPLADIARDTGQPEGTIRWRFHQAKKKMKERLAGTELDFSLEIGDDGEEKHG